MCVVVAAAAGQPHKAGLRNEWATQYLPELAINQQQSLSLSRCDDGECVIIERRVVHHALLDAPISVGFGGLGRRI